jgi:hypothetical protein
MLSLAPGLRCIALRKVIFPAGPLKKAAAFFIGAALSRASARSHFLRFSLISGVAASANISLITLQLVITVSAKGLRHE